LILRNGSRSPVLRILSFFVRDSDENVALYFDKQLCMSTVPVPEPSTALSCSLAVWRLSRVVERAVSDGDFNSKENQ
jgi:hypothetical protein